MITVYEDADFIITRSDTKFDKFVIFCNSAAGLDRIGFNRVQKPYDKSGKKICDIYTPFGINEINFWSKNAHWYQRDSTTVCLNIIKSLIKGYEKNSIIYGSSMGGFGAISFGSELGITSVAFSPQVTLAKEFDIAKDWYLPLEYAQKNRNGFISNIINGKCNNHIMFVFYDDTHILDIKHAQYIIKNCLKSNVIAVSGGGHGLGVINKIYPFKNIIIEILRGRFNEKKFLKQVNSQIDKFIQCICKEYKFFGLSLYKRVEYRGQKKIFFFNQMVYKKSCKH